jgi:hypothetical protein
MNLLRRWIDAMHNYDHSLDYNAFAKEFGLITREIKKRAGEIFNEKDWMEWLDERTFFQEIEEMQALKKH